MKKRKFYSIQHKSLAELGVANQKQLWEKAKSEGYEGISVNVETKFMKKSADNEPKLFRATFSSSNTDRHGDIVHQVFHLVPFQKNPIYLDSHNYDSIEHIIGRIANIGVQDGVLQGDIEFATMNPKGALAERMAENGFLHASSIGFIPMAFNDDGDIIESELLEISAVSVPANADALYEKEIGGDVEEPKENIEEPVINNEPEVTEVVEEKPVVKSSKKSIATKAIEEMVSERKNLLKNLAKDVQDLTEKNRVEKKRKIYQAVRELLNQE